MPSQQQNAEARPAKVASKPQVKRILCQAWNVGQAVEQAIHQAQHHPGKRTCKEWADLAFQYEEAAKHIRLRPEFAEFLLLNHCKN